MMALQKAKTGEYEILTNNQELRNRIEVMVAMCKEIGDLTLPLLKKEKPL